MLQTRPRTTDLALEAEITPAVAIRDENSDWQAARARLEEAQMEYATSNIPRPPDVLARARAAHRSGLTRPEPTDPSRRLETARRRVRLADLLKVETADRQVQRARAALEIAGRR